MDPITTLCVQLSEALSLKNATHANELSLDLIRLNAQVSIQTRPTYVCHSHPIYFQGQNAIFLSVNDLKEPCNKHFICDACIMQYVELKYSRDGNNSIMQCPICEGEGVEGTRLFAISSANEIAIGYLGEQRCREIQDLIAPMPIQQVEQPVVHRCVLEIDTIHPCIDGHQLLCLRNCEHLVCFQCFLGHIRRIRDHNVYGCPNQRCRELINKDDIIEYIRDEDEELFREIIPKLHSINRFSAECPNCYNFLEDIDINEEAIECVDCGNEICPKCLKTVHIGSSCYAAHAGDEELVECPRPVENIATSPLEKVYQDAFYAYRQFDKTEVRKVKRIYLCNNAGLTQRFNAKEAEFQAKGEINEIWGWHGTLNANYSSIRSEGFKIGGVNGHAVRIATEFGYGVYLAVSSDIATEYAESSMIMLCRVLRGTISDEKASTVAQLASGNADCYMVQGYAVVAWNADQVLPFCLLELGKA